MIRHRGRRRLFTAEELLAYFERLSASGRRAAPITSRDPAFSTRAVRALRGAGGAASDASADEALGDEPPESDPNDDIFQQGAST